MYAIATRLIGFRSSTLRVRITERRGDYVWVITADLLDAGTKLVLDASQIEVEGESEVVRHRDGLVSFA